MKRKNDSYDACTLDKFPYFITGTYVWLALPLYVYDIQVYNLVCVCVFLEVII